MRSYLHSNPRHIITLTHIQQLPTSLLLLWTTIQFLNTQLNTDLHLRQLTVDILVLLVRQIATSHKILFCGFLPCRRCLRSLKSLPLLSENRSLLYYITCVVFRVRNAGAEECSLSIPNSTIIPLLVIPSQEETAQILRSRGVPIFFPSTATSSSQNPTVISTPEVSSAEDSLPSSSSRRRRRSPDRMEGVPNERCNLGTSRQHRLSSPPSGVSQVTPHISISPPPGMHRQLPSSVPTEASSQAQASHNGGEDGYITE